MFEKDMVKALRDLISIPSVTVAAGDEKAPFGEEVNRALNCALDLCGKLGFRTKNCGNQIGWAEIGEGEEMIAVLVHLDVVPAGEGWSYPPFGGEVKDGKLYGRGAVDDKGPAAACIYAMKELLDEQAHLGRRIRIIFGLTEEDGDWIDMDYYKANEEVPVFGFTPDAFFPAIYGEKGLLQAELIMKADFAGFKEIQGGEAPNMVADFCRAVVLDKNGKPIELEKGGVSAHASMPEDGINAISKVMAEINAQEEQGALDCRFARFYTEKIGFCLHGEKIKLGISDSQSGKLTFNVGKIHMTQDEVVMEIDIRYPVTVQKEEVTARLLEGVKPYDVTVRELSHLAPVYMDKDGDVIKTLLSAYREITGDLSEPAVIGGATYARAMDNIVAFGPLFSHREPTEHKKDEHIYLEDLEKIKEIYKLAIKRLAQ